MTEPITHTVPRREGQTFDDALATWLFTSGLLGRVRGVADGDAQGTEIHVRFEELDELDAETLSDLRAAVGLDDPIDPDGPCPHLKETAHDDGTWTCDRCEEDTTSAVLARLIETIQAALAKGWAFPPGHRGQASAVIEAAHWMSHAHLTATYVASMTRAGYPEILP